VAKGPRDDFDKNKRRKIRALRNAERKNKPYRGRAGTSSGRIEKEIDRETGEISYIPEHVTDRKKGIRGGVMGQTRKNVDKTTGEVTNKTFGAENRGNSDAFNPSSGNERGEFDNPDTTGDLISLKVKVNFNQASWSETVAEIKALENMIHAVDLDQDFYDATGLETYVSPRKRLTHFRGVYRLMNQMALRANSAVPPLWPVWKEYVATMNAANFSSSGLPVGGWSPYDAEYAAIAGPKPDLVRTGVLSFSLTSGLLVDNVDNDSVEFGTRVEYAKFHQYGTTKMPARKIVFEPQGAAKFFGGLVGRWVARERVASGGYEQVG